MLKELELAELLARQAGELILRLRANMIVHIKPGEGLVTDADLAADELIRTGISENFPEDGLVTEESFPSGCPLPKNRRVWFVDPIDGTFDYVRGGEDFAVMIGLTENGIPAMGVVFQPATGTLWAAIDDQSTKIKWAKKHSKNQSTILDLSDRPYPSDGPVIAVSRHRFSRLTDLIVKQLEAREVVKKGSVGLKMLLVADGEVDLYVAPTKKIKVWDTCAPGLILRAAGGLTKTVSGEALTYTENASHQIAIFSTTSAYASQAQAMISQALQRAEQH